MHPNRKKIVLVIVEGPSDETALGVIMNRLFRQNEVIVHVMRSDITSELSTTPGNIVSKINMSIRSRFGASFKSGDFLRIIHIVDTDGAFVDESAVVQDEGSLKTEYTIKEIHTKNREKINGLIDLMPRKRRGKHGLHDPPIPDEKRKKIRSQIP